MKPIDVSDVFSKAWIVAKENMIILLVITVASAFLTSAISSLFSTTIDFNPQDPQLPLHALGQSVTAQPMTLPAKIIGMCIDMGVVAMILSMVRGTFREFTLDFWKKDVIVYVKYVAVSILTAIAALIGACFCIIPGIWIGSRLMLATTAVIDHPEIGILDALQFSWNKTTGNDVSLILFVFAAFLVVLLGILCCCVGAFPAAVVVSVAEVVIYQILTEE